MKMYNITLLAALVSAPLAAETTENDWEIGVFGDYIKSATGKGTNTDTDWGLIEAGRGLGVDLQKVINERWNARVELAATRYDIKDGNDTDNGLRYGVDAVYKVEDTDLYLFAGVRRFNNTKSYNAIDAGAGYSFEINDRFSFYTEAAAYRDVDYGETDLGFKLGVKYAFGGSNKSVAPAVVAAAPVAAIVAKEEPVVEKVVPKIDSDNDGVYDSLDNCNDTLANLKVDANGCAIFAEEAVDFNMNVVFANNSSALNADSLGDVESLANFMQKYPETKVTIEGHSSAVGSAKYNLTLSQKRADSVKAMLINQYGIDANRLGAIGFGETQLLSTENTKEAHKKNRRVIASIEAVVKKAVAK